jgi:hypothetical protein
MVNFPTFEVLHGEGALAGSEQVRSDIGSFVAGAAGVDYDPCGLARCRCRIAT